MFEYFCVQNKVGEVFAIMFILITNIWNLYIGTNKDM